MSIQIDEMIMQDAWSICVSRLPTVWKSWMVTGKDNTAFGSMISTESAFVSKATTSLMWRLSIITDRIVGKEETS